MAQVLAQAAILPHFGGHISRNDGPFCGKARRFLRRSQSLPELHAVSWFASDQRSKIAAKFSDWATDNDDSTVAARGALCAHVLAPTVRLGSLAMSSLSPTIVEAVVAACQANAAEVAGALRRSLDGEFSLGAITPGQYAAAEAPTGFDGPGLVVLLTFAGEGLAICVPESSGLLPAWYASPDAAEESKLQTLAQELSRLLTPETLAADKFDAQRVESLASALRRGDIAAEAALVTVEATSGARSGQLVLIWPLATPEKAFAPVTKAKAPATNASDAQRKASVALGGDAKSQSVKPQDFSQLPNYARTLLKIRLPVSVQLASKKESVKEVVELVPGAIIKFEKGCDELLHMSIGGQLVAEGEAVKVGDKFGFRVTAMMLPQEHFVPVRRPRAG
jgi:flagellar motor switch protein FliN/FliY